MKNMKCFSGAGYFLFSFSIFILLLLVIMVQVSHSPFRPIIENNSLEDSLSTRETRAQQWDVYRLMYQAREKIVELVGRTIGNRQKGKVTDTIF